MPITRLEDYQVPPYLITDITMEVDLTKIPVRVKSKLTVKPNPQCESLPEFLELDGEKLTLDDTDGVKLNGVLLQKEDYELTPTGGLKIKKVPQEQEFTLESTTLLSEKNTDLFGLYKTAEGVLVKAETQGLRRVLFCSDRPDNPARFTTIIKANKQEYKTLLSNGEKTAETFDEQTGVLTATWIDSRPKPTYLFALVAGNLELYRQDFVSRSGKVVPIEFYLPNKAVAKSKLAMETLKKAMEWDETVCGLMCEMVAHRVAVFNRYASGASETIFLNLFSSENFYASQSSRTDEDQIRVMEVVAHEYFHYWTGNRITIRDWFNLTFKEGLTTFRASMFLESILGEDILRFVDGKVLDAQPPRPDSYTAVRSLYTAAAYEKSGEIFKMMKKKLGDAVFYSRLKDFLLAHDDKAVTLEALLDSLEMAEYLPWFTQSATPQVQVRDSYDPQTKTYQLVFKVTDRKNRPIPFDFCLYDAHGQLVAEPRVLDLDQDEIVLEYPNVQGKLIPSLLRNFSAPVQVDYAYENSELLTLMQHDSCLLNRCDSAKLLISNLVKAYCANELQQLPDQMIYTYQSLVENTEISPWILAEVIKFPTEEDMIPLMDQVNLDSLSKALSFIKGKIASAIGEAVETRMKSLKVMPGTPSQYFDIEAAGIRKLKNSCLSYLNAYKPDDALAMAFLQFNTSLASNMTDCINALTLIYNQAGQNGIKALDQFYRKWNTDNEAMSYWYKIIGGGHRADTLSRVKKLFTEEDRFDRSNPSQIYALLRPFIRNPFGFHAPNAQGYQFMAEIILKLDSENPPVAANLTTAFSQWPKMDKETQKAMLEVLSYLQANVSSENVKGRVKEILNLGKPKTQGVHEIPTFWTPASVKEKAPTSSVASASTSKA